MAVVARYSKAYPDPTALSAYKANPHEARAVMKATFFNIGAKNGDSVGSVYYLGRIPSYALLSPLSSLYSAGVAGLTSLSLGIDNRVGTKVPNALMNAVNVSGAGSYAAIGNVAPANYGLRVWQLLGLAADPKDDLDIIATVGAAVTADGVLTGHLYWNTFGY